MVKGCERRVIVYKSHDSKYFYEAYFFMKPDVCREDYKKSDILREVDRIIEESSMMPQRERKRITKRGIKRVMFFVFSCALSSIVTLFVCQMM